MNIVRTAKRLIKNLIYLSRHSLEEDLCHQDYVYDALRHAEDLNREKMVFSKDGSFKVMSDENTWQAILAEPKSIIRIGDGELSLMEGKSIDFQMYDKRLADYLIKILSGDRTDLYIGIDYNYFNGFDHVTEQIRKHNYLWGPEYKKVLVKYCNPDRKYISSSFNQLYIDYDEYDWEQYLKNIRNLFAGRDVVVFAGKGIFEGLRFNVFDNALSCEYVWSLSRNAFNEFDALLAKARSFSKDKTLCFILGPTSKPLVYELSKEGYMAWDLGHMAKDYDCCCRRAPKGKAEVVRFFAPD